MDPTAWLQLLAVAGFAVGALWVERRRRATQDARARLPRLSAQFGLDLPRSDLLKGTFRGWDLSVHIAPDHRAAHIEARIELPRGLTLKPYGVLGAASQLTIGDPALDGHVDLAGPQTELLVALSPATRALVAAAVEQGWSLADGKLSGGPSWASSLGIALEVAVALNECGEHLTRNLAARVREDPLPAVRRNALRILWERADRSKAHAEIFAAAAAHALQDPDEETRFRAAELSHDEPTMVALGASGYLRALQFLAVEAGHQAAAREVLEAWLERGLADTTDRKLAFISALRKVSVAGAEAALIGMLGSDSDSVQLAAAESVSAIGTVAAVPVLMALRESAEGLPLRRAAGRAILAIQARTQGAETGALALAEAGFGELALSAEDDA